MSIVFVISAPSGSGKSTLVGRLLAVCGKLRFSVSHTTRRPRGQERQDRDYRYVSRGEFEDMIRRDEFLEWAEVFGNYYGTHRSVLEAATGQGCDLVLDIDVQGARQLKVKVPDAVTIFVLPPSRQVLEERLRARSEDSGEAIRQRLLAAAREIREYSAYDYVLVNRDVEESTEALAAIVKAERIRRARVAPAIQPILATFDQKPENETR
jgi:guanylate kinase